MAEPMTNVRTEESFRQRAIEYVDGQISIMEKYGHMTQLTTQKYWAIVHEVAKVGEKLWISTGGKVRRGTL